MMIDIHHFTPWLSLLGGMLIGLSASWFILFNGKIAGISGIIGGMFSRGAASEKSWRLSFLLGIIVAPLVYQLHAPLPNIQIDASWIALAIAGLIVGISTRFGAGCTSGHGICGLARFSIRSLVATLAFMLTGFATVAIVRHIL